MLQVTTSRRDPDLAQLTPCGCLGLTDPCGVRRTLHHLPPILIFVVLFILHAIFYSTCALYLHLEKLIFVADSGSHTQELLYARLQFSWGWLT